MTKEPTVHKSHNAALTPQLEHKYTHVTTSLWLRKEFRTTSLFHRPAILGFNNLHSL
jgi:hypothetical protein